MLAHYTLLHHRFLLSATFCLWRFNYLRTAVASNSVAWQNVTTPSTYKKVSVVLFLLWNSIAVQPKVWDTKTKRFKKNCLFQYQFLQIKNGVKIFFRTNSLHFLLRLIIEDGITIPTIMKVYIASGKNGISNGKRPKCWKIFALIFAINPGTMYKSGYQTFCITIVSSS